MPLKDDYFRDPPAFLRRYATRMPGSGHDGGATPPRAGDFMPIQGVDHMGQPKTFKTGYDIGADPVTVAWHVPNTGVNEVKLLIRGAPMNAGGQDQVPSDAWFEAYFLPWNQGCAARLKIPSATRVNAFFTAEMNGCCFVVGGSEQGPWTAHLNVADPAAREAKWRQMTGDTMKGARFTNTVALRKWAPPAVGAGKLGRLAGGTPGYQKTDAEVQTGETQLGATLTAQNKKITGGAPIFDLKVSTMGVRDPTTGRWSFFYQRNLYVQARGVKKRLGRFGGLKKFFHLDNRGAGETLDRYLSIAGSEYRPLWPTGPGRLVLPAAPPHDDDLDLAGVFKKA